MNAKTLKALTENEFTNLLKKVDEWENNDSHFSKSDRKLLVNEVLRRNPELQSSSDVDEDFVSLVLNW